jgi:hypothetical protein
LRPCNTTPSIASICAYSLVSLQHLFKMHNLEVFHARPIPSHGGSIRVYAARHGAHPVQDSVQRMASAEPRGEVMAKRLAAFRRDVILSKLRLLSMLRELKKRVRASPASARRRARARWSTMWGSTKA